MHIPLYAKVYWSLLILVGFGVPEAYGLIKGNRGTLSEYVWWLIRVNPGQSVGPLTTWTFAHLAFLGLMLWLDGHFILGIWR